MKSIICALSFAALVGCAATGVQVSQEAAMQFKEGQSTEAEILAKLGRPTGTTIMGGAKLISYTGMQYQVKGATLIPIVGAFAGGSDYTYSTVVYEIDRAGVMQRATYSTSGAGSRAGVTPVETVSTEPRAVK